LNCSTHRQARTVNNIDIAKTYIRAVQTGDQATLGSLIRPRWSGTSLAATSSPVSTAARPASARCWARWWR